MGKGRRLTDGTDVAILSIGHIGNNVIRAVELLKQKGISAAHYDMIFLKPIDQEILCEVASKFSCCAWVSTTNLSIRALWLSSSTCAVSMLSQLPTVLKIY